MCTNPSCFTPISTNAPKSVTFLTVPVNTIPSFKSSNFNTSALNTGFGISSLGSLPGFESSCIISFKVISPIFNCFAISSIFISANLFFIIINFSLSNRFSFLNPILFNNFSATS